MIIFRGINDMGVRFILEMQGDDEQRFAMALESCLHVKPPEPPSDPSTPAAPAKRRVNRKDLLPSAGVLIRMYHKGHLYEWKLREELKKRGYSNSAINETIK